MQTADLVVQLDHVLDQLRSQPSYSPEQDGWTGVNRQKAESFLLGVRDDLANGRPLPELSLSRALDFWGIHDGKALDEIAAISNELRMLRQH